MKTIHSINKFNFYKNLSLPLILLLSFLIFGVTNVEALTTYKYFDRSDPIQAAQLQDLIDNGSCQLPDSEKCPGAPSACFNSASVGITNCGTACKGGSAWSKYSYLGCYQTEVRDRCTAAYDYSTAVYSTADKCDGGQNPPANSEPYLRGGNCGGTIGGTYKTCCTNTTPSYVISDPKSGMGSAKSCLAVTPYSGAPYPPYDGVCPAGSIGKFCGFTDTNGTVYPACGQAACGTIPGTSPSPSPSPTTCTPGEYDERCTAYACSAGSADCASEIYQCNASGTGWDYQYPQCNPDKCGSTCSGAPPPPPPPSDGDPPPPPPPGNMHCYELGLQANYGNACLPKTTVESYESYPGQFGPSANWQQGIYGPLGQLLADSDASCRWEADNTGGCTPGQWTVADLDVAACICGSTTAEASMSFSPSNPSAGDTVTVTATSFKNYTAGNGTISTQFNRPVYLSATDPDGNTINFGDPKIVGGKGYTTRQIPSPQYNYNNCMGRQTANENNNGWTQYVYSWDIPFIQAGRYTFHFYVERAGWNCNSTALTVMPLPPTPRVNVDLAVCATSTNPYTGNKVNISWDAATPAVTHVDISNNSSFASDPNNGKYFYNKRINAGERETTAPNGFSGDFGTTGALSFAPATYYVRTWNGTSHSLTAPFTIPLCPPQNLTANCGSPGNTARLDWTAVDGATRYALRINDTADLWCDQRPSIECQAGTRCQYDSNNRSYPNDFCLEDYPTNSYLYRTRPGDTYSWWLHACNSTSCSAPSGGPDFPCFSGITPWIQTTVGDVHSQSRINTPGGPAAGAAYRADGLVSTPVLDGTFNTSSNARVISNQAAFAPYKIPTYEDLKSLYYTQSKLPSSGAAQQKFTLTGDQSGGIDLTTRDKLYYIKEGNLTIDNPGDITDSQTGIVFVDKNLTIGPIPGNKLTNANNNTGLVFVVGGDVNIDKSVTQIDAVIISAGKIYTATTAGAACRRNEVDVGAKTNALIVNGSLISLEPGSIIFCRKLDDDKDPAEVINNQPKYLVILRDLLSDTFQEWEEIP